MNQYIKYFKYVLRHKYFVFRGALKVDKYNVRLIYRALVHDLSKLTPLEFLTYANTFYKPNGDGQYNETPEFNFAWNSHQKRNKHHWQYWVLLMDKGTIEQIPIPDIYIKEMIADWIGAGWAITGKWDNLFDWYEKNAVGRYLNDTTRNQVEDILAKIKPKPCLCEHCKGII